NPKLLPTCSSSYPQPPRHPASTQRQEILDSANKRSPGTIETTKGFLLHIKITSSHFIHTSFTNNTQTGTFL
ncbi:hypothetical protein, partial [Pedobacter frigoris]|uniref:hypothetical protein n=1 Tax=Pedobacter frigoris TaxID=2571272 RepID=UPI00197E3083